MSSSLLPLFGSLPFAHPKFLPLLQSHKPFTNPSQLSQSSLTKLLNRLNSTILSREDNADRRAACIIATEIVSMDEEGYVLTNYGKGWLGTCLGFVASPTSSIPNVPAYSSLLQQMVYSAAQYPSFEREVIHPIMGKLAVSLGKLFERCVTDNRPDWSVIHELLSTLKKLIVHSPAPFRPLLPALKPSLFNLILQIPTPTNPYPSIPDEIRRSASEVIACLHVTAGKAQSPQSWGAEIKEALGGFGKALNGITTDAWEEEPVKVQPPNASSALPELPVESSTRLPVCLDWAEGFTEVILALLRYPTARPVPVPIAQITVTFISPQHQAALLACLPRLWTIGVQLIGILAISCGDHLFPHLSNILEHTVWLAERTPASMTETQIQLLKFHRLLLSLYPPAIVPLEYPTRLLRLSLTRVQPLLENRAKSEIPSGNTGGGKRGKKRARGAEDGLVGGLEGRDARTFHTEEVEVIIQALFLIPLLHPTPLFSPSLLTFSIRLHLSLYLSIPSLGGILPSAAAQSDLQAAIQHVLEQVVLMTEGEGGTGRGWKSLIISVLAQHSEKLAPIVHPSLPPLMRPLPPLSQLHFFVKEGEEERKERLSMGFGIVDETNGAEEEEAADGDMVVEQSTSQISSSTKALSGDIKRFEQNTAATQYSIPASTTATASLAVPPPVSASTTPSTSLQPVIPAPSSSISSSAVVPSVPIPEQPIQFSSAMSESITTQVESNFISHPSANADEKGKGKAVVAATATSAKTTQDMDDIIMLNDEDDEGIPELDSGSDDFDEDDDDEEEVEEDE
uniref:Pre-rRNA-processing protein RIX1 n=1 Tax=Kwoniella dejecticola CBS 10117 TaxID=1296121 RepID=A0A1A6ACD9_9TREE|nr:uncharacterized protein I303_01944 [Kwoniella dejecticola CBS 10117]OBR87732.1 hypothetical protein I303_01944 [Kwoniella dejecticola CBS 10117]